MNSPICLAPPCTKESRTPSFPPSSSQHLLVSHRHRARQVPARKCGPARLGAARTWLAHLQTWGAAVPAATSPDRCERLSRHPGTLLARRLYAGRARARRRGERRQPRLGAARRDGQVHPCESPAHRQRPSRWCVGACRDCGRGRRSGDVAAGAGGSYHSYSEPNGLYWRGWSEYCRL